VPQYYLIPKRAARAYPWLGRFVQGLEAAIFRCIFWSMGRLSPERASALSGRAFSLLGVYNSDKSRKADTNLSIAFPERSAEWRRETVRKIFHNLGKSAAELIKLEQIWRERDQRLEFVLEPEARAHMEAKQPSVFVTAHVGAWQITNLVSLHMGLKISTVYAPESNVALADIMYRLRESFGVKLIPSDAGARPLPKELNQGHSIGLAMDTRLDTGQLIPYFGRDALTNITAARLALRTNAALLPIRAERLGQARFRITVYDPVTATDPDASMDEQAIAMTTLVNEHFEAWVRDNPEQWICLKRRWPKAHKL
jgi:KDO2-lipid IV(A) lauroyltransferase